MATLSSIRSQITDKLRETSSDTHFADSVLNGYINEAQEFTGAFLEYPRQLGSVQAVVNTGNYPTPTNNLIIRTAYFGDNSISGDLRPLTIVTEETLRQMFPNWLDASGVNTGRPGYLIMINETNFSVYPRPNALNSATNKMIWLNYNYVPTALASDLDIPNLPIPAHNLLQFYALHLCYITLTNQIMSDMMFKQFMSKLNSIKTSIVKETQEGLFFQWGDDMGLNPNSDGIVNP